jgi:hypothetical protein
MLYDILTPERLSRYGNLDTASPEEIIAKYGWNIALSESLYPTLSVLEVCLRNQIDAALSNLEEDWLSPNSCFWKSEYQKEFQRLRETINHLKPHASRGHLIAELNLGFWIGLCQNRYKPNVWNKAGIFESVFPNCNFEGLDRISRIQPILRKTKTLRNRISHHEAIFDYPNLPSAVKEIQTLLKWVSKDADELRLSVDRFQDVYSGKS